jgi:hypothetical protein
MNSSAILGLAMAQEVLWQANGGRIGYDIFWFESDRCEQIQSLRAG